MYCEKRLNFELEPDLLDSKKCYLVFRGTDTKEGLVSKDYNICNNKPSHVGICVFKDSKWKVYHVLSPAKKNITALVAENFEKFFDLSKESIQYASIWVIDNLTVEETNRLKKRLSKYEKIQIKFDLTFKSLDTTKLYCSEFVNDVLMNVNNKKFKFEMSKVKLKPLHAVYLAQDSLEYFPVDLFQYNKDILLVKEWTFQ